MSSESAGHGATPANDQRAALEEQERELRRQLAAELDRLAAQIQALTPEYQPPPFSPRRFLTFVQDSLKQLPASLQPDALQRWRASLGENLFDPAFWQGLWYMLNHTLQYNADMVRRHYRGEYETDEWGLDWEIVGAMQPFLTFLYKTYWRVEASGVDHIPVAGRALLVANHSGQLPWDAAMVGTAVRIENPAGRWVRTLYSPWFSSLPVFSSLLVSLGQAPATVENGTRLLEQDEVVAIYPEGREGAGKLFKERYRLARFGDADFVRMALSSGAPIIPVAVVGAEETYITLARSRTLARITGLPDFPITLAFPWLGLLGLVPLPTRWSIDFGQPIPTDGYGPDAALNLVLVSQLADRVRSTIQTMLGDRLARRRSLFLGTRFPIP
jgi:1-acyl-sn-glycerol-3-phosphate acyltransferase